MRKIALFLLLTCSISLFSQWNENFSDGNLSVNPTWSGNTELFVINSSQQLQLNATATGSAFLSTQSKLQKGTTWEFWVKLNFNPSQYNYGRIYLASDDADPATSNTGYFITIGGASDKINLSKRTSTSTTTEIIAGETGQLNLASVSANIKVEFTHQSVWRLFVKLSSDADYVLKGEYTDNAPVDGDYFILNPIYTVSNIKNFYFDDINVSFTPFIDNEAPKLTNLSVNDKQNITLSFDEEVDISKAEFTINGIAIAKTNLSVDKKSVELNLSTPLNEGVGYSLMVKGVKDLAGNLMADQTLPFTYWSVLENAKTGDVVISEIMANPTGAATLPEVEYVEIHNNSTSRVNLSGWKFYYGDKSYILPDYWLLPDSFVVMANPTGIPKFSSAIPKIGISSFPALANTGKLIYLESPQGELISFANYTDQWYGDDFKAKGGFSLECIDLKNIGGQRSNWKASTDKSGGTPGKPNSILATNPDTHIPTILQTALLSADSVRISFSDVMRKSELVDFNQYALSGDFHIKNVVVSAPIPNSVIVVLDKPLSRGDIVTIELKSLHSISGIALESNKAIRIALSEMASLQDVIINEILFNPRPNGADYVELYNRSNRIVDLSKLYLTSKKSDGTFQSGTRLAESPTPFFPSEFLVLTTDKTNVLSEYPTADKNVFLELSSLPSMSDTEGNIQLINASAEVIDGFFYTEKMHHPFVKNPEGVALERLNSEWPTTDSNNWTSSSTEAGWGTPGVKNSQQTSTKGESKDFWLETETITPDNNGIDDLLHINYALDQSGYSANVRIYSSIGKLISVVANNTILGTQGLLTWKGTDSMEKLVDPGIYILYVEYHKIDRPSVVKKMPVVVGN
ncbi:MAG: lamin tail domain-containing protein [Bacteroidales bacterium]